MLIEETKNTPFVHFSTENSIFEIKGNSFSDNLEGIYSQIVNWIDKNIPKINHKIDFKFNLYIFNSISYKKILQIMSKFHEYNEQGKKISVTWVYNKEDEDSKDVGEDLKDIFNIPVTIIEKEQKF